jgi:predicted GNAT family acetyltransferase
VQLVGHADSASFLASASKLLLADEPRHNLILGLCATLAESPTTYPEFGLWTVDDASRCVAAALITPPHNLVLARPSSEAALDFMARELHGKRAELPGVTGALPEAERFAAVWRELTGSRTRVRMRQAIYRITSPRAPANVPGAMRPATADDRALLTGWVRGFESEAFEEAPPGAPEEVVDSRLASAQAGIALWVDGEPVSMAGFSGPTPHGIRIGPVYTPPERRRRGYASALVAALSAKLLAEGRDYCFLYTDLANPTSNKIYTDVGYAHVCESVELVFDEPR